MNELVKNQQVASLLVRPAGDAGENPLSVGMPFPTTITLCEDIVVAGTTHVRGIDGILEGMQLPADVSLVRDVGNLHDRWAIKILHNGKRIGFVPCDVNEILARLMDGGKKLTGTVFEREALGRWNKLHMEVNLVD